MTARAKKQIGAPAPVPRMTYDAWLAEGQRRFGADFYGWRFVCPICSNVAAVGDFKPFKDQGATPDTATVECIGRYCGTKFKAFGSGGAKERGKPCDYAMFGLFHIAGVIIAMPNGKERMAFAFAEVANADPIFTVPTDAVTELEKI
jgi:hypothetical protein